MNESLRERGGKTALVVIDVQVGVVSDGWDRDGVVSRIAKVQAAAREAGIPVIHVQHEEPEYPPMMPGGESWPIVGDVAPLDGEPLVAKRYPDAFVETSLAGILEAMGVGHLVIAGAQSDYCVRSTFHRALAEGYDITLVSDAHTTGGSEFGGVEIPAEVTVAQMNAAAEGISYPNVTTSVVTHNAVIERFGTA